MRQRLLLTLLLAIGVLLGCGGSATVDSGLEGTVLFERLEDPETHSQVVWLDLVDGSQRQISRAGGPAGAVGGRAAPNDAGVLYGEFRSELGRIVIMFDPEGDGAASIISDVQVDEAVPAWSTDCRSLFFGRFAGDETSGVWRMNTDGTDRQLVFASNGSFATGPHQSLHHDRLLLHSDHDSETGQASIYSIDLATDEPLRITPTGMLATWGQWSPVADQIAFEEWDADGSKSRVAIIDGDGTNLDARTDFEDGPRIPIWSPDGEWIAFRNGEVSVVAIHVATGRTTDLGVRGAVTDWGPHGRACPESPGSGQQP